MSAGEDANTSFFHHLSIYSDVMHWLRKMWVAVHISPYSKCEQVWSQQWGNEDEENIGGEDSSLHHLRLPNAEGALLLRVLKHKLSAENEGREEDSKQEIRDAERAKVEQTKFHKCVFLNTQKYKIQWIQSNTPRCFQSQTEKMFYKSKIGYFFN